MAQIISNEQNTLSDLETRLVAAKEEEEGRGKNGGGAAWQNAKLKVSGLQPVCLLMDPFKLS